MKVYLLTFSDPEAVKYALRKLGKELGKKIVKEKISSASDFLSTSFSGSLFSAEPQVFLFEGLEEIKDPVEMEEIISAIKSYHGEVILDVAPIYELMNSEIRPPGSGLKSPSKRSRLHRLYNELMMLGEPIEEPGWEEVVNWFLKHNSMVLPQEVLRLLKAYTESSVTEAVRVLEALKNLRGEEISAEDMLVFFAGEPDPEFSRVARALLKGDLSVLPQLEELARREKTDSLLLSLYRYVLYSALPRQKPEVTIPHASAIRLLKSLARADRMIKTTDEAVGRSAFLLELYSYLFKL